MNKDFNEFKEYIKNKRVAVVGIGVSNIPLIEFLLSLGAVVTGFDKKTKEELGEIHDKFISLGVNFSLGMDYLDGLHSFDVIFKTPSMRIDGDALVKAKEEGSYITSEMEEFVRYCKGKIFAVTGSDGKTTTTSIVYELLKEEGYKTCVGGNIGFPLFSKIEEIKKDHKVVLELSSFQLMTMNLPIEVSAITNLSPNHLDMHKSMEEYVEAKENIYKYQRKDDLLILNKENNLTYNMKKKAKGRVSLFSSKEELLDGAYNKDGKLYLKGKEVCKKEDVKLLGTHNIENFLTAFLMVSDYVSIETMKKVAKNFSGVAHRNEFIREVSGVKFYNDSIATTPSRTLAGLKVFEKPVVLIAGGYDKKIPLEYFVEEGSKYIKALILLGNTKEKIKKAFQDNDKGKDINIFTVNTLKEAVEKSMDIAEDKDIVTLSPACASFDMYKNFELRGEEFKNLVRLL